MNSAALPAVKSRETLFIVLALVSLYFIWGSTYLGIHQAVQTGGFASFQLNATRFIFSGLLLLGILLVRGAKLPNRVQTRNAALIGLFLVIGGMLFHANATTTAMTMIALPWQ